MIDDLQKKQIKSDEQVSLLKAKIDRLRHRASYLRSKFERLSERNTCSDDDISDGRDYTRKLEDEVRLLKTVSN